MSEKLLAEGSLITSDREGEEAVICEALVREISWATRWIAVVQAWGALLHVRRMGAELRVEEQRDTGAQVMAKRAPRGFDGEGFSR